MVERWFARLSRSAYAGDFVLKGGMLLAAFGQRRPTDPEDQDMTTRDTAGGSKSREQRAKEVFEQDNEIRKIEDERFEGSTWDNEWENLQPRCKNGSPSSGSGSRCHSPG